MGMLELDPYFGEGAVVQRDVRYPVRGTARPGSRVRVTLGPQSAETVAGPDGSWEAWLGPQKAGGSHVLHVESGGETLDVGDVLVGDVWVCSGQSNMEMALRDTETGPADAAATNDPTMRLCRVPTRVELRPAASLPPLSWKAAAAESAASFSALGFYFGRALRAAVPVPLGLIQAAVGSTPGESWTSIGILQSDAAFRPIIDRWQRSLSVFPDTEHTYEKAFARWDQEADLAEREGRPIPGPFPKLIGPGHPWTPAGLFNGMIMPLTRFPVCGVIWYQGASSPDRAYQYRSLFRALIRDWRRAWGQGDFPFLFGQEAMFGPRRTEPGEHSWAELREAQMMALAEPNTAMAVAIDTGEERNIHPLCKRPLGERLALAARALVHGQNVSYSGPVFRRMAVEGNRARLWFDHVGTGLRTSDGKPPRGFAVSGGSTEFTRGNRGFVWAEVELEGDCAVVHSARVPKPVAVRYAWAQNPDCNLVEGAGLPASPFRTDDYPGVTVANR